MTKLKYTVISRGGFPLEKPYPTGYFRKGHAPGDNKYKIPPKNWPLQVQVASLVDEKSFNKKNTKGRSIFSQTITNAKTGIKKLIRHRRIA